MAEFTMSAFALYPDGTTGEAFATVHGATSTDCFEAMAGAVRRWLSPGRQGSEGEAPDAIELILSWSGSEEDSASAGAPSPHREGGAQTASAQSGRESPAGPQSTSLAVAAPCTRRSRFAVGRPEERRRRERLTRLARRVAVCRGALREGA